METWGKQYQYIQTLIDIYKPKNVLLITDNDVAGFRYDINLLGRLRAPISESVQPIESENFVCRADLMDKYHVVLTMDFTYSSLDQGQKIAQELKESFLSENSSHVERFTLAQGSPVLGDYKGSLKMEFFNSIEASSAAFKIINNHRALNNFIQRDKARGISKEDERISDWNQKLMDELHLKRKDIPKLMQQLWEDVSLEATDVSKIELNPFIIVNII